MAMYRVPQVAEYFGVSSRTVRRWIEKKILLAGKIGNVLMVPEKAIRDFEKRLLKDGASNRYSVRKNSAKGKHRDSVFEG